MASLGGTLLEMDEREQTSVVIDIPAWRLPRVCIHSSRSKNLYFTREGPALVVVKPLVAFGRPPQNHGRPRIRGPRGCGGLCPVLVWLGRLPFVLPSTGQVPGPTPRSGYILVRGLLRDHPTRPILKQDI